MHYFLLGLSDNLANFCWKRTLRNHKERCGKLFHQNSWRDEVNIYTFICRNGHKQNITKMQIAVNISYI